MRSFDFSNDTFDFRNLSRLIYQMALLISETCLVWFLKWHFWFPKFVAFDFSNGVFDFQNETDMDLIHVTVSVGGKAYARTGDTQSMVTTRPNEAAKVFWWKMGMCRRIGFGFPKGGLVLSVLNRDIYLWIQESNHIFTWSGYTRPARISVTAKPCDMWSFTVGPAWQTLAEIFHIHGQKGISEKSKRT